MAVAFQLTTSQPRHPPANNARRAARLAARGIEAHVPQQHQDVRRGVPPAIPRRAATSSVDLLEGEQPRSVATLAVGPNLVRGCIRQVAITCQWKGQNLAASE
jgi:hypothetical protein